MWTDPIVAEVRRARQEHAARFGFDLREIYDDLKKEEAESELRYVRLPIRRLEESLVGSDPG